MPVYSRAEFRYGYSCDPEGFVLGGLGSDKMKTASFQNTEKEIIMFTEKCSDL